MSLLETIKESARLLGIGHVQQADLDLRRALAGMAVTEPEFIIMDEAARLIWPENKPKEALKLLEDFVEHIEREKDNGTRTA